MKFRIVFLSAVFLLAVVGGPEALDWVPLHNMADRMTLEGVLREAGGDPGSLESLYVQGLIYLNGYRTSEARTTFQKMLLVDPDSREARWGLAEIMRRGHDHAGSVPVLEKLIREDPRFAPAYITLAYINYIRMNFDETARLTGKVINLGSDHVDQSNFVRAHGLYAAAKGMLAHYGGPLSKTVNGAAVLKHLNIIRNIAPTSPVVNFGLGSYYMLIPLVFGRNLNKAEQYLNKAVEADPLFPDPYVRLAQISLARGDRKKYEVFLDNALQLDPGNELALDIKTRTCRFICLVDMSANVQTEPASP